MKKYVKPSVVIAKYEFEDILITSAEVAVLEGVVFDESENIQMNLNENHLGSINYEDFKKTN